MNRIAIIDLGTNTFNLLIVEGEADGSYKILHADKQPVKLGQGGITKKLIAEDAFERGIVAVKQYVGVAHDYQVNRIFAFGTSAVRGASNGQEFIKALSEKAGVEVEVVSGDREAEYIYYGVRQAIDLGDKTSLIMDIGGGSTEFILCNAHQIFWKGSYDLGVTRLLELFTPADPVTIEDVDQLEGYFDEVLEPLFKAVETYPTGTLVGSSGSFDSFAEMITWQMHQPSVLEGKTGYEFDLLEFSKLHQYLLISTLDQRLQMKGLIQMRADTIALAGIFVNYILQKLHLSRMRLSTYALKEGVVSLLLNGKL